MRKIKNQTTMNGCAIQVEVNMHDYYITIFKNWMHSLQLLLPTQTYTAIFFSIKQLNNLCSIHGKPYQFTPLLVNNDCEEQKKKKQPTTLTGKAKKYAFAVCPLRNLWTDLIGKASFQMT